MDELRKLDKRALGGHVQHIDRVESLLELDAESKKCERRLKITRLGLLYERNIYLDFLRRVEAQVVGSNSPLAKRIEEILYAERCIEPNEAAHSAVSSEE